MAARLSLYDLVGDLVIYRNLDPVDPRLPCFAEAWAEMGLPGPERPRKHEPAYAEAMAWFLRRARALDRPDIPLRELVYLGDTALSDGNAFRNLRAAGRSSAGGEKGWRGWAFIGAERDEEMAIAETDGVYVANRWSALAEFLLWVLSQGAVLDACTAVVVDIDKTALGARGRNDSVIDRARVVAVEATVAEALGAAFNQAAFRQAYIALNVARYHPFTADNQDYLAYICLVLGSGILTLENLLAELADGRLKTFQEFIAWVERLRDRLPGPALQALHDDIYARVQAGDPTPFKAFRRREFRETVDRLGCLPDDAPLARQLVEEICLTQEVVDVARWFRGRGCLLIALSDKPDEATMPSSELVAQGYLPLHRIATHVVGQSIADLLPEG